MARTRVRWARVSSLAVAAVTLAAGTAAWAGGGDAAKGPVREVTVTVVAGDTLWSIARRVVGEEGDPRPVVQDLIDRNGIAGATIHLGQRLVFQAPSG
jgi:hypothetical protein